MSTPDAPQTLEAPNREELAREHSGLCTRALAFKIENPTDHEDAQVFFRDLKAAEKRVDERLRPIIDNAHKAHKGLTTFFAEVVAPIREAYRAIESKCIAFEDAQRRKAAEAERIAQENARKAEEERLLREAVAADEAGDKKGAAEILEAPVEVPTISVKPAVAVVKGVGSSGTWIAEVTDLSLLVKHVAANCDKDPGLLAYLDAAGPALNSVAKAQKSALRLPGVRAVEKRGLRSRSG